MRVSRGALGLRAEADWPPRGLYASGSRVPQDITKIRRIITRKPQLVQAAVHSARVTVSRHDALEPRCLAHRNRPKRKQEAARAALSLPKAELVDEVIVKPPMPSSSATANSLSAS